VTFTPTDTTHYTSATGSVTLQVNQARPQVPWVPIPITYGTPLGPLQLDALTIVPGKFAYTPPAGTILGAGNHTLSAVFTPKDATDFETINVQATLVVLKALPRITWAQPASIKAGTPLTATQLNATANVPGTFKYKPSEGTVLKTGTYDLYVTFAPTDTSNYQTAHCGGGPYGDVALRPGRPEFSDDELCAPIFLGETKNWRSESQPYGSRRGKVQPVVALSVETDYLIRVAVVLEAGESKEFPFRLDDLGLRSLSS
jgi:hypothetical protein